MPAVRAVQGVVSGRWKTVEVPTGQVNTQLIAAEAYLDQPITEGWPSQLETMCHTPLTVLMPPG